MKLRAWKVVNGTLYVVIGQYFCSISNDLVCTSIGELYTSAGNCWIEFNQISIFITDDNYGYHYNFSTFTKLNDFPAGRGLAFANGFLLSVGLGDQAYFCFASNVFDATQWNAANNSSVESQPDKILRPVAYKDAIVMYGESSIEVWAYNGDGSGFPFSFQPGTAANYGLAAVNSVAGISGSVAALLNDKNRLFVGVMNGYEVVDITKSQRAVAEEWSTYGDVSDAVATSYAIAGCSVYQLSFPTANKTWIYEANTGIWARLETNRQCFIGELAVSWNRKVYMSNRFNGDIFELDESAVTDYEYPIRNVLISSVIKGLSSYSTIDKIFVDMEVGTTPFLPESEGYDPQISMSVSADGGYTYKPAHTVPIGKQGEYKTRVTGRRFGRVKDGVVQLEGSGLGGSMPVKHVIYSTSEIEVSAS